MCVCGYIKREKIANGNWGAKVDVGAYVRLNLTTGVPTIKVDKGVTYD